MLKIDSGENSKFFAVKKVLKIGGKKHVPSVCYPITDDIAHTIDELVAQNLAVIFAEKVRFISGRAVAVGAAQEVGEPSIVYLPPKVQGNVPGTQETTSKAKTGKKTAESSSSVSSEGAGEFASQALS